MKMTKLIEKKYKLAILVPVLRRPQNILPLATSVQNTTKADYALVFIVSPSDHGEITELDNQELTYIVMDDNYEGKGDYARKINTGFKTVKADWYLTGADDLKFHANWFEVAMRSHTSTGACVIGTNDLGNPRVKAGKHSTHTLILGEYAEECGTIDEPGKILHEGYHHNFCDDELVATAKWRGAWTFSFNSIVEHKHPLWGKTKMDEVYESGHKFYYEDERLFNRRKSLWK